MQTQERPITRHEALIDAEVYLKECASCGGQFPSFREICSECEDVADADGFRDGRKVNLRAAAAT